jgi:hypothetical protein
VCERCVHFNTDELFLPVLELQHEDAVRKGQQARIELFANLIASLHRPSISAGVLPSIPGPQVADFSAETDPQKAGGLA